VSKSSSSAGTDRGAANNGQAVPAPIAQGGAAGGTAAGGAPKAQTTLAPADVQRSIIYTGSVVVRVNDVDTAATEASDLATAAGGYVGGDDRHIDASRSIATLTLRVPSGSFYSTVTAVSRLGQPQSRNVSTQDVTGQVIDVQSRLKTQQASVDRIRALLASTTSISQIVSLEDELTQREADLESMEAQLRSLTDLATLSTITATLLGPQARVVAKPSHRKTGFIGGLEAGWNGFVASLTALLTVIGAILPFAVAIGVPVLAVMWYLRRRRRLAPQIAAPAVATGPPPADGTYPAA
jgi:hypothetical protein